VQDDEPANNFVTAATNLRGKVYGMEALSAFKAKEMGTTTVPTIAPTTNPDCLALNQSLPLN
jgi:hypothetical protein